MLYNIINFFIYMLLIFIIIYNILYLRYIMSDNLVNVFGKGLKSDFWGPSTWLFLHSVTFTFPLKPNDEIRKIYFNFFYSLQFILPCNICRMHYAENIKKNDTELNLKVFTNRNTCIKWLYDIHVEVNKKLNKTNITLKEVIDMYEKNRAV